jgi:hypothetical protein
MRRGFAPSFVIYKKDALDSQRQVIKFTGYVARDLCTFMKDFDFDFWCFNATFSSISSISWRPVLVVEEAGVSGENHRPWASNW